MGRWIRNAVIVSFALIIGGAILLAIGMAVGSGEPPQAAPGERITFRPGVDIPVPVGVGLVILGGVVAWWSLIRRRPPGRSGHWGFWAAVASALINPVVVLPAYWITRAFTGEIPMDWGTPFEFAWIILCLAAIGLGITAARRDPARRGLLLVPAVVGAFVLTFALAEVVVPH